MLRWDWTICSLCTLIIDGSIVRGIGRAHVITYREWKSSLWPSAFSFKFCISTPIPILEMAIFVIHNHFLDETNLATICMWSWEPPQYGHPLAYSNNEDPIFGLPFDLKASSGGIGSYLLTWMMSKVSPPRVDWIIKCIFRSIESMNEKKIYSERMDLLQMTYIHIPNSIFKLILIIICCTYNHVLAYVFVLHCVKTTFQSLGPT